jgi:hypothetical protein
MSHYLDFTTNRISMRRFTEVCAETMIRVDVRISKSEWALLKIFGCLYSIRVLKLKMRM